MQNSNKTVLKIKIENEMDVVLSYRRAMQLSEFTGMPISSQTKFATAISEICRNVVEHVGVGNIEFLIAGQKSQLNLEALVTDSGRGIVNLDELLQRKFPLAGAKGHGIFNSRRLVDSFEIESEPSKGTRVWLRKRIPLNHPPINNSIIQGWRDHFSNEQSVSPYSELKKQNTQLIELLDQLRLRNLEAEHQLEEIKRLNCELEATHTEVYSLLEAREKTNQQLRQANRDLDDFAYTVSHDLKAPLRNLESLVTAINESLRNHDLEDVTQCMTLLDQQVNRMDYLIASILRSAQIGHANMEKTMVATERLLQQIVKTIRIPKGFQVEVSPGMPHLETEELLLEQVFTNLITNAIKHHDQEQGLVQVSCHLTDTEVRFTITDNGPGIARELHDSIFRPFASNSRKDSTGLGLSIVKKIVEEKGGKVWVESDGRGSCFIFTWPAKARPVPETSEVELG